MIVEAREATFETSDDVSVFCRLVQPGIVQFGDVTVELSDKADLVKITDSQGRFITITGSDWRNLPLFQEHYRQLIEQERAAVAEIDPVLSL